MNKENFVNFVSQKEGISKKDASNIISIFTNAVIEALGKGENIHLIGFGSFSVTEIPPRKGHNPRTGEPIDVKGYIQPKFKAGQKLKDSCNAK